MSNENKSKEEVKTSLTVEDLKQHLAFAKEDRSKFESLYLQATGQIKYLENMIIELTKSKEDSEK